MVLHMCSVIYTLYSTSSNNHRCSNKRDDRYVKKKKPLDTNNSIQFILGPGLGETLAHHEINETPFFPAPKNHQKQSICGHFKIYFKMQFKQKHFGFQSGWKWREEKSAFKTANFKAGTNQLSGTTDTLAQSIIQSVSQAHLQHHHTLTQAPQQIESKEQRFKHIHV